MHTNGDAALLGCRLSTEARGDIGWLVDSEIEASVHVGVVIGGHCGG